MKNSTTVKMLMLFGLSTVLWSCRKDKSVTPEEQVQLPGQGVTAVNGLYILNEGNFGSNKASLDYYDYATGVYRRNLYGAANPSVTLGLGDVGNDIKIYGSKLYVVVNGSNKLEILDVKSTKKLAQVDIPNCRYVAFYKNKAYVTSYDGYVGVIDTASFKIDTKITVGRQPEDLAVVGDKLYVANSGGYSSSDYERSISVINLTTNLESKRIDVAINLNRLKADQYGDLYVTSRGDYYNIKSNLYVVDTKTDAVKKKFDIEASTFTIDKDFAYIISTAWSNVTMSTVVSYSKINVKDETVVAGGFIKDGSEKDIVMPYGIAVDPISSDIYLTDAKDYVSPGALYCFDKTGKKKFSVVTGDVPAHLVFYTK